jgi:hypothetical protein
MPSLAHAIMLDNLKQKIEVTFLGLLFPKQAGNNKKRKNTITTNKNRFRKIYKYKLSSFN